MSVPVLKTLTNKFASGLLVYDINGQLFVFHVMSIF